MFPNIKKEYFRKCYRRKFHPVSRRHSRKNSEGVHRCFSKVGVLEIPAIFTEKQLCWSIFLIELEACKLLEKTPTQVFSCAYCKIFKSSLFYRTPPVAASDISRYETGMKPLSKKLPFYILQIFRLS